jgi:hypothetical protein
MPAACLPLVRRQARKQAWRLRVVFRRRALSMVGIQRRARELGSKGRRLSCTIGYRRKPVRMNEWRICGGRSGGLLVAGVAPRYQHMGSAGDCRSAVALIHDLLRKGKTTSDLRVWQVPSHIGWRGRDRSQILVQSICVSDRPIISRLLKPDIGLYTAGGLGLAQYCIRRTGFEGAWDLRKTQVVAYVTCFPFGSGRRT